MSFAKKVANQAVRQATLIPRKAGIIPKNMVSFSDFHDVARTFSGGKPKARFDKKGNKIRLGDDLG